jgi:transposase
MYYIGLDVHKKTISYCVKDASGQVHREGTIGATRNELDRWIKTLPQPRIMAMEATIFTGWIYDHLLPHAEQVKVAHPLMLRAIALAKKKNDRIDAGKIADCLRCDFLPECHMASTEIRDRRRTLRYRHLLVRQMVQMKNRVSGLLLETGVSHNKQRLHKVGYFRELLSTNKEVQESIRPLLKLSRETDRTVSENGLRPGEFPQSGPIASRADQTPQNGSWSGTHHRAHLGLGDRRCDPLSDDEAGHQLLWAVRSGKELGRESDADTTFQATQQAYPACAGGGRQAGPPAKP